ncbi:hypothetical protein BK007_02090 [Methanobacterium subterraneum]|uniref:Uncharacterized protein n=1 Tax=Methanobacterium subterraneum TaxID=59277 RepID=A0A2H4VA18_9EURY|nr:AAA family ATPase [Methanobacterium subterraneum]AUB54928.1 hypothetical protein BK007_02090 [Methanobacterium subterraneum]
MKLRHVIVKNFRSLKNIDLPIDDNTILIGENNSGKTALLEALRIALSWGQRGSRYQFKEYDYHMNKKNDDPSTCDGIHLELWFKEDFDNEWPASLLADLDSIIQTDPVSGLNFIGFRVTSSFDENLNEITEWNFLNLDRDPIKNIELNRFRKYVRLFYLSSLRDSKYEFSPSSKFWGSMLKDIKISKSDKESLIEELSKLNESILDGDPRLKEIAERLNKSVEIMGSIGDEKTSIRALPLKPWDLLSKSELVIKPRDNEIDFPINLHGQGVQSLSILFLFQAYIDIFLKPTFEDETEAILALEEPESHLHPQATRSIAKNLYNLDSQTLISTHSPYFIQEIPFEDIRMFRRTGPSSKVLYLKRSFIAKIPQSQKLDNYCQSKLHYEYEPSNSTLTLKEKMTDDEYKSLIKEYLKDDTTCKRILKLKNESKFHITDNDLAKLDTFAKRIRGEILFARGWLLCEGQSDYLIIRYFADLIKEQLDIKGITIIDFQNNGSPNAFVSLANNFEIPWLMICDSDEAGNNYKKKVKNLGYSETETDDLVKQLPGDGNDLEKFLLENGFLDYYLEIIDENGKTLEKNETDEGFEDEVLKILRGNKIQYAIQLIEKLEKSDADETIVPKFFSDNIKLMSERTVNNE